jgi:hypothetical protein
MEGAMASRLAIAGLVAATTVVGVVGGVKYSEYASDAGDSPQVCDVSKFQDMTKLVQNYALRLAFLDSIDESNFETKKKQANLSVLLDGVPLGASYADFSKQRSEYKKLMSLQKQESYSSDYLQYSLSSKGAEAYRDCITQNYDGFKSFVSLVTPTDVTISMVKKSQNGDATKSKVKITVNGRLAKTVPFLGGGSSAVTIPRVKGRDMSIVVSQSGKPGEQLDHDVLFLPRYVKVTATSQRIDRKSGPQYASCPNGSTESPAIKLIAGENGAFDLARLTDDYGRAQSDCKNPERAGIRYEVKSPELIVAYAVCSQQQKECHTGYTHAEVFVPEVITTYTTTYDNP